MHFTLLVAGALLPGELAVALSSSLATPTLKSRIARAALAGQAGSASADSAHLDWLAHKLFAQAAPAPTAPYAYARLSGAISNAFTWHADPVHVEIARDHLIVQSTGDALTKDESTPLMNVANELASDLACRFIGAGDRWFLQSERDWAIDAVPLAAVLEAPVVMPGGRDAQVWNRLHNEIQMAWHTHAVNQAREANQLRTINGIWLHGGGRWKPLPPIEYAQVHSDEPTWQGAAQAAGALGVPSSTNVVNSSLLVIDDPWLPKRLEDWEAWLRAMAAIDRQLANLASDVVDFVFTGKTTRTFESRPSDRYKPWRRRTLAEALTE
ncbi:MAG TPA: hypothetical protein VES91_00205 [Burkholderiaceae bacterium]|nr:hypothetical protein [Burkholderiaceae bacterium]